MRLKTQQRSLRVVLGTMIFAMAGLLVAAGDLGGKRESAEDRTSAPRKDGPAPGSIYTVDPIVGNLRFVPFGTYIQGSTEDEPCRDPYERSFTHTLTRSMAVMETEVTRRMWAALRAVQPDLPPDPSEELPGSTPDHPVQMVNWYAATLFANLLSLQHGLTRCYYRDPGFTIPVDVGNYNPEHSTDVPYNDEPTFFNREANGYRLPTEGEWEYFCRAGTTGAFSVIEPDYHTGSCLTCIPDSSPAGLDGVAWWCGNSGGSTHPAGQKAANPWGLRDVHGNVWEWCWDWFSVNYPATGAVDYEGVGVGLWTGGSLRRVIRGGTWITHARFCRSAARQSSWPNPSATSQYIGFRLLRPVQVLAAPSDLRAWGVGTDRINLFWRDNADLETGFKIERKTGGGAWSPVATVGADVTAWSDTGLAAGTACRYRVCAFDPGRDTPWSNESGAMTTLRAGNFTIGGYLGVGTPAPQRAVHILGSNAVFRMDRSQDTAAFMLVRTDPTWAPLKTFVVGVDAAGVGNGKFVINDLGSATGGAGTRRLTLESDGTSLFGGTVRATGFFTTSARRYKTNIRPLPDAPQRLGLLRGVRFDWRDSGRPSFGFLAGEVAPVLPELANGDEGVDYRLLAALLVEGVKAQQARIDRLEALNAAIRAALDELEKTAGSRDEGRPRPDPLNRETRDRN